MDLDIEMMDAVDAADAVDGMDLADHHHPDVLEATGDPAVSPPDSETQTIIPTKLHVRGLDVLSTNDVKAYVSNHHAGAVRVEWIDDTSANLAFDSKSAARDALVGLSAVGVSDPSQLPALECVPAKALNDRPEINLQVRFAFASDVKHAGAADRSRYYLLNPDADPTERRRRDRTRHHDRHGVGRSGRESRRGRMAALERDRDVEVFNDSFYDDATRRSASPAAREQRHRHASKGAGSDEDDRRPRARSGNTSKELFPGGREKEGRELFPNHRAGRRDRSASPRGRRRRDASLSDTDGSRMRNKTSSRAIKERLSKEDGQTKELFPAKTVSSSRRGRLDQLETAIGSLETVDTTAEEFPSRPEPAKGTSIRGQSKQLAPAGVTGLLIRGAAKASVAELFPNKLNANQGKELFAGARAGRRSRAEDLFY